MPPEHVELAWSALVIAIVITSVDLQTRLAGSVLIGLQRNDLYAIFQTAGAALLCLGVVFGFRAGMGLRGFAAVMTLGPMFAAVCSWVAYRRLLPRESLRWTRPDWPLFREMIGYSVSTILYAAGSRGALSDHEVPRGAALRRARGRRPHGPRDQPGADDLGGVHAGRRRVALTRGPAAR